METPKSGTRPRPVGLWVLVSSEMQVADEAPEVPRPVRDRRDLLLAAAA